MSGFTEKLSIGVASCAMVAAATLTPVTVASVAHAAPATGVVGNSFAQAPCDPSTGAICPQAVVQAAAASPNNIFQNQLWWIGPASPNAAGRSTVFEFTPLSLVPGFLKPAYSWFTQNLNFEACFLGASIKVGPYGTTSLSVGRGCN